MTRQKLIILIALLLLLAIIFLMVKDFFYENERTENNPYSLQLDKFKHVDEDQLCYYESSAFTPDAKMLKGIAVDLNDNIYVTGDEIVQIFNSTGKLITTFPTGKEIGPLTVFNQQIYLSAKDHLEIWSTNGELIHTWKTPKEKCLITSIAVSESSVFVADAGNRIVYHYNHSGELINEIGRKNKEKGIPGFFIPSPYFDLLIGRDDELWVVNPGRHAFEAYKPNGELISTWSKTSMQLDGFSGCCNPSHIAMLSDGSFVTSEKGLVRIKIHEPSGDFKCVVAQPHIFDNDTRGLDLAVDSEDKILVLDPKERLVRIFEKISE
jgi:hypothetical protein